MKLLLALVVGSLAFGATRAAAQVWVPQALCEDPLDPPSFFKPLAFVGLAKCPSLCAQAAKVCKGFVKDAVACRLSSYNGLIKAEVGLCSEENPDATGRKKCLTEIKGEKKVAEEGFLNDLADGFSGCEAFLKNCTLACSPT